LTYNYNLYFQFIEAFLPSGFTKIDRNHPLLLELEEITAANNQFFFVADLLQLKILFTSRRSVEMIGLKPEQVEPSVFFTATHPDDLLRHNTARTKLFSLGHELYIEKKGNGIISTNFRTRHVKDQYSNILVQCYVFYSEVPYRTAFLLQVCTDISWYKKMKHGYHYYTGTDLSLFRYPDEGLLLLGNIFSNSQFRILQLLAEGCSSEQIAGRLFLSIHTINTHRRNMLKISGKSSTHELILDLKASGML
jgi:DNA-binding CsgD family transcriptional regulator